MRCTWAALLAVCVVAASDVRPDAEADEVRYDEYPVVVPKRTALLLDRLMVDIKNLMDDKKYGSPVFDIPENTVDPRRWAAKLGQVASYAVDASELPCFQGLCKRWT